ncbi:predicted protein [Naegleria gruberi]|uniref:Predicted protein n=1 Tax=Naegleria gruberi TaxID=5762 RepID=D2VRD1_NAEGR|nr:uncharacterized protein NAEGRDRAFT_51649 [Naegleria gruberi]EFC40649.1 predicted protein [Naegleria gruberi]|eukprot:XP_002673393.1 predicted protein [Naegleria gruberi strain NEG-M]
MLKRISIIGNRSSALYHHHHQFASSACSYHTSQTLSDVTRRVSVKPTTTTSSSSSSNSDTPSYSSSSNSSYKKTNVSSKPAPSQEEGQTFQIRGSVNSVHLIGTLASDAVIKEIANGGTFTGLTVVTSERIKKGENIEEQSTFHSVVSFNPVLAKVATKFFKKGVIVSIRGSLKYREVEKDGVKHVTSKVVVDDFNDAKVIYGKFTKE